MGNFPHRVLRSAGNIFQKTLAETAYATLWTQFQQFSCCIAFENILECRQLYLQQEEGNTVWWDASYSFPLSPVFLPNDRSANPKGGLHPSPSFFIPPRSLLDSEVFRSTNPCLYLQEADDAGDHRLEMEKALGKEVAKPRASRGSPHQPTGGVSPRKRLGPFSSQRG